MFAEIRATLRPALVLLILLAATTGLAFPMLITGIAQMTMPAQANGSLIRADNLSAGGRSDGGSSDGSRVVGSALIAQGFTAPGYFHPRPSSAGKGYDASSSAATNLAPGSRDLRDAIADRIAVARARGLTGPSIPSDLVTTSASGLDPDLSPEAAISQSLRVAKARGISPARVRALVQGQIVWPLFGIIGEPHVNVLLINRQLDRIAPKPAA